MSPILLGNSATLISIPQDNMATLNSFQDNCVILDSVPQENRFTLNPHLQDNSVNLVSVPQDDGANLDPAISQPRNESMYMLHVKNFQPRLILNINLSLNRNYS